MKEKAQISLEMVVIIGVAFISVVFLIIFFTGSFSKGKGVVEGASTSVFDDLTPEASEGEFPALPFDGSAVVLVCGNGKLDEKEECDIVSGVAKFSSEAMDCEEHCRSINEDYAGGVEELRKCKNCKIEYSSCCR